MTEAAPPETAGEVSRETGQDPTPTDELAEVPRETVSDETTGRDAAPEDAAPEDAAPDDAPAGTAARGDGVLDTPIMREARQAVHVLNVRQENWPRPGRTRVITVANQKGGVGKTTTAVNVAAALALHGLRVCVIDLDPQGNASTAIGIDHSVGTPSVYDVLLSGADLGEITQPAEFAPTLTCAPATLDLAGADIELTAQVAREYRLKRALTTYLDQGEPPDYVFIDCPPSLGLLTLNALVAAREMFIPIQCEYYALEGLVQLLDTVELVRAHLNPDLEVSTVLLTMYDSRTRLADQVAAEVRNHFGELVLAPMIPRNVRVSEAPGFGQTVMTYDAGSRGAIKYLEAAHELALRGAAQRSDAHDDQQDRQDRQHDVHQNDVQDDDTGEGGAGR